MVSVVIKRSCVRKLEDAKDGLILEDQYGDRIRASMPLGGRKGNLGESKVKTLARESEKARGEEEAGELLKISDTQVSGPGNEGVGGRGLRCNRLRVGS